MKLERFWLKGALKTNRRLEQFTPISVGITSTFGGDIGEVLAYRLAGLQANKANRLTG